MILNTETDIDEVTQRRRLVYFDVVVRMGYDRFPHVFCNMDVSADSDLKEDLERNGWTISALTVLFWSYIRLMLIDKRQENLEVCCVPYMSRHRVAATLSSSGHYIH